MEKSIFTDKNATPSNDNLKESLGDTYHLWQLIKDYIISKYPKGLEEWNYSNYGWSFKIKDKKRAIVYLLPRDKFFKVAFVFGQRATDIIMQSQISQTIKTELSAARVYAEGRGIRIDVKSDNIISDIKSLIDIKMAN